MTAPLHEDAATWERDTQLEADVVVVGTGAGGAVAACELAEAGRNVLLVEEGPWVDREQFAHLSTLDATALLYRDQGLTASQGRPPVLLPMGRCVGGTTMINLGTTLRMREEHFAHWKRTGLDGFDFGALDAAYDRIESRMPTALVPDHLQGPNTRLLIDGTQWLGLPGEVLSRNAPGCRGAARCYLGCPNDAKQAMHLNYVPAAVTAGARMVTRCRVTRILVDKGHAVGLVARSDGPRPVTITVRAKNVVVACGAILSPLLLMASGLGRGLVDVGRHLGVHPACRAIGEFDSVVDGHLGVPQAYHIPVSSPFELYLESAFLTPALMAPSLPGFGRAMVERMSRYRHLALAGFRVIEAQRGQVTRSFFGLPVVEYNLGDRDLAAVKEGLVLCARLLFESGARAVHVPVRGFETLTSSDQIDRLRDPAIGAQDLELSGYHAHGTLRMGVDPATGVVDARGRVHGVGGVRVADASLFPTSSRVNPQLTVMALASLVAQDLLDS